MQGPSWFQVPSLDLRMHCLDMFFLPFFNSLKTQEVQKAMDERRFKDAVQLRGRWVFREKTCFTGSLCSSGLVLECTSRRCLFCINISQKLRQYAVKALFLKVNGPGD